MMISSKNEKIEIVEYTDEKELQQVLEHSPELLDERIKLYTIYRELNITAGIIDLLMLSENGDVIVVETKLSRNYQSRREVVAQIIDYISGLANMSYYELDKSTKNSLGKAIDNIETELDLPKIIDDNLRSGRIKLIIAVDKSNDDLTRIVQFLSDHTDFAIELTEIKKYEDSERKLYASTNIVNSNEANDLKRIIGNNSEDFILLDNITGEWNSRHPDMLIKGNSRNFRQIFIPPLPANCHYEFFIPSSSSETMKVRFDNEFGSDYTKASKITNVLKQFDKTKIKNYSIDLNITNQSRNTSKLVIQLDKKDVNEIIDVMEEFIKYTSEKIKQDYFGQE